MGAPPLLSSLPGAGALPPRSPSGFNKPVQEWPVSRLVPSQHDSRFPRISRTGSLGNFTLELMADWFLLVDERIAPKAQLKVFSDGFFGVDKKKEFHNTFYCSCRFIPRHFSRCTVSSCSGSGPELTTAGSLAVDWCVTLWFDVSIPSLPFYPPSSPSFTLNRVQR